MFGVDLTELIVVGMVALVVIGPERLPGVARTLGHLLGRMQRYVGEVKADIEHEMRLEELRQLQSQMRDSVEAMGDEVRRGYESARDALATLPEEVRSAAKEGSSGEAAARPRQDDTA